jgi:hypothetical protein
VCVAVRLDCEGWAACLVADDGVVGLVLNLSLAPLLLGLSLALVGGSCSSCLGPENMENTCAECQRTGLGLG